MHEQRPLAPAHRALLAPLTLLALAAATRLPAQPPPEIVRGITISTHTDGREWGTESMSATLRELRDLGANWVAIHPYARIDADGSVRPRGLDELARHPTHLRHPIDEAHRLGLSVLVKPHLAYWGSPFAWRGAIDFGADAAAWQRFFATYEAWVLRLAEVCSDADGLAVGTELDGTIQHEAEWRRIIAGVRARTDAALTYASNWTDYRRIGFWDALDAIGIQAYFPISESDSPTAAELERGWAAHMAQLRSFAARHDRRIVFTELGYNQSFAAAKSPWRYETDGPAAEPLQVLCMRTALEAVESEPLVAGVFLWKWFPAPRQVGRNFQLATPRMRRLLADLWRWPGPQPSPERSNLRQPRAGDPGVE
jgi:hypothetical protein